MRQNKRDCFAVLRFITAVIILLCAPFCWAELIVPLDTGDNSGIVSLDLKGADLISALKIISAASKMNIVLDKDVQAQVNITLKDVPWQTALENILNTNELTYRKQDNIIRVMTLETIKKEESIVPLETKIITLNFAKTDVIKTSLSKMLSARGSIEVNIPTNSLIINDSPEVLAKLEEVANKLDVRTPQVMIEAVIMSVKGTDSSKFGMKWTMTDKTRSERKITSNLNAIAGTTSSFLDFYYGKTILPEWNISDAVMSLYAEDKTVNILANPRILTLDNLSAQIEILEQVSYQSTSQSTDGSSAISTTEFKDVGIKLYVTPHITKDKFISLSAKVEQSYVASYTSTNQPSIDSRKVETNFMLQGGQTVVIGGLKKKDSTITVDKVPILGDIPILGLLFKREIRDVTDTELLIFITPRIVEQELLTEKEGKKFQKSVEVLNRNDIVIRTLDAMASKAVVNILGKK